MFKSKLVRSVLSVDQSCIFIPDGSAAPGLITSVTGRLWLYVSKDISVKAISVRLVGSLRIPRDGNSAKSCQGGITFERSQTLATSRDKSFIMPRGMYVLPFELPLSQDMPETVTGVGHKYHSYEVQSIIFHRNSHRDTIIAHPIRLHRLPRILQGDLLDQVIPSVDGLINESLWYRVLIPSVQIPFGASFPVRFEFHSLQKHFSPGKITLQILETHLLKLTPTASDSITYNSVLSTIARKEHAIVCETHENLRYTNAQSSDLLDSEWATTALVHLPQSFYACTQDLHSELIQVHHKLQFEVEFETEHAQRKKIVGAIPFEIYMSPCTVMEHDLVYRQNLQELEVGFEEPPPPYLEYNSDIAIQC